MALSSPLVFSNPSLPRAILYTWPLEQPHQRLNIPLDSPEWFLFLAQQRPFRFTYHLPQGGTLKLTIRPKKRASGLFWLAYPNDHNYHIPHIDLAPLAELTKAILDDAGQFFFDLFQAQLSDDPIPTLFATLADLTWLVHALIRHGSHPSWIQLAHDELARIDHLTLSLNPAPKGGEPPEH